MNMTSKRDHDVLRSRRVTTKAIALVFAAATAPIAAAGCASAPPPETIIWQSLRRSGDSVTLALDADSKVSFTGIVDRESADGADRSGGTDGETSILVEDLKWFDNWHDGWTEAEISCEGRLVAERKGDGWSVRVTEPVIPARATKATVRYRDALLRGNDALNLLDRRLLRIRSACGFLRTRLDGREFPLYDTEDEEYRKASFRHAAGTLLFPEMYGYAEGAEPADGESNGAKRFIKGEGLRWDTLYSERELPAELRDVRDTGTLWRDWEEMGRMFYYLYLTGGN